MNARYEAYRREELYRIYITDNLYYQGEQKRISVRYVDIVNGKETAEDPRTGDEIAEDVISRLNLKMVGGE